MLFNFITALAYGTVKQGRYCYTGTKKQILLIYMYPPNTNCFWR